MRQSKLLLDNKNRIERGLSDATTQFKSCSGKVIGLMSKQSGFKKACSISSQIHIPRTQSEHC